MSRQIVVLAFFSLVMAMALTSTARAEPVTVELYQQQFGVASVDPDNAATLSRITKVFERLRSVADRRQAYWPELVVLKSNPRGPALALPDGHIVLGLPAAKELLSGGEERLAFVLGHELAHFAEDDFWHARRARGLTNNSAANNGEAKSAQLRSSELRADERGFVFAAMAGYRSDKLLARKGFFNRWVSRYDEAGSSHSSAADRSERLKKRLTELRNELGLYRFAVQLASFGRCSDALPLFKSFRQQFPAREVLYNSGLCQLQLALQAMPPAAATQFWLPAAFDAASLLDPQGPQGPLVMRNRKLSPTVRRHLVRAADDFDQAARQDDRYWPALLQQAVVLWLLEKPFEARAAIEAAAKLQPNNIDVLGMRELIKASVDGQASAATQELQALLVSHPEASGWRYNLARLLEKSDPEAAKELLTKLAPNDAVPVLLRGVACRAIACSRPPQRIKKPAPVADRNIALGRDVFEHPLSQRPVLRRTIAGVDVAVFQTGSTRSLSLDGIVEMQSQWADIPLARLQQQYGNGRAVELTGGELHHYGHWAARETAGKVVELQWALH